MNTQLFYDLAASEESSGYPENARALRAVPDLVEALNRFVSLCPAKDGSHRLGGHAPMGAFNIAADYARQALSMVSGHE